VFSPLHLNTEIDPISETSCFLFSRIPDDRKSKKTQVILCVIRIVRTVRIYLDFEYCMQIPGPGMPIKITKCVCARNLLGYVRTLWEMWSLSAMARGGRRWSQVGINRNGTHENGSEDHSLNNHSLSHSWS
jgi:hypothetical protein